MSLLELSKPWYLSVQIRSSEKETNSWNARSSRWLNLQDLVFCKFFSCPSWFCSPTASLRTFYENFTVWTSGYSDWGYSRGGSANRRPHKTMEDSFLCLAFLLCLKNYKVRSIKFPRHAELRNVRESEEQTSNSRQEVETRFTHTKHENTVAIL